MNRLRILVLLCMLFAVVSPAGGEQPDLLVAQGIERVGLREYQEAADRLSRALEQDPGNAEAAYYAGFAYSRLGNFDRAEALFRKTLELDPGAADAYFELGLLYARSARCGEAEQVLTRFREMSPDDELRQSAAELIEGCREGALQKRFRVDASIGGNYDTNVILEADNPPEEQDGDDFAALFFLSAGGNLLQSQIADLKLDYDFFQSLHKDRSGFNVTYNRVAPTIRLNLSERIVPSVGYAFEYDLVSGDAYSRFHSALGKVRVKETESLATEAHYEYRDQAYWDADRFAGNSQRSGSRNTVGLTQWAKLRGVDFSVYGRGDFDRADRSFWSYDAFRFGAEAFVRIRVIHLGLEGSYEERRYRDEFPGSQEKRFDRMQQYTVMATYLLTERIGVTLSNTTVLNDSNLGLFEYTRNITGLFLSVGIL
ncbi:MAG: tetratricopeptide repeat protein [bacterium]